MAIDSIQQLMIYIRTNNAPALRRFLGSAARENLLNFGPYLVLAFEEALTSGATVCAEEMLDHPPLLVAMAAASTESACRVLGAALLSGNAGLVGKAVDNTQVMALAGKYACYSTGVAYSEDRNYNLSFFLAPKIIQMAASGYHEAMGVILADAQRTAALLKNLNANMLDCFAEGVKSATRSAGQLKAGEDSGHMRCISVIMGIPAAAAHLDHAMHNDAELFRALEHWTEASPPGSRRVRQQMGRPWRTGAGA